MNLLRALVLLAVAVAVVAFAPNAHADGDPASDYLLTQQVFLPSDATASSAAQRQLLGLVQAANRDGFAIRVAIIPSSYDLGSVTELWRVPRTYARFLSLELSFAYTQRLLVVMPNGLGFNWPSHWRCRPTGSSPRSRSRRATPGCSPPRRPPCGGSLPRRALASPCPRSYRRFPTATAGVPL